MAFTLPTLPYATNALEPSIEQIANALLDQLEESGPDSVVDLVARREVAKIPVGQVPKRNITAVIP